tara:strand:+ start:332 stop:706 length:375 start_codon:yes stop_codon:yes gene_type:complete
MVLIIYHWKVSLLDEQRKRHKLGGHKVMDYNKTWEVMNNLETSFNRITVLRDMIEDLVEAVNNDNKNDVIDITHALNAYMPVYTSQYEKASRRAWNNTVIKAAEEDVPYRGVKYDGVDLELETL